FPRSSGWQNETLAHAGFLGTSPVNPQCAISFKVLELFYALRARSYSPREAFVRSLDDIHGYPSDPYLVAQFSRAFDVYVLILREVDQRIAKSMDRLKGEWRMKNSCPCCAYECEDEPELTFRRLLTVDGNNSAKRFANAGVSDQREFESDYFLSDEVVDSFSDALPDRGKKKTGSAAYDDPDPTAGDPESDCTDRWKNANSERTRAMWKAFEESGIFACVCRHGFIVGIANMRRSGELAKYPLAMTQWVTESLGDRLCWGYDIGCAFEGT
ncbi:hypothetical protein BOTBODRAFT_97123, partial [Botryobasidium botryosum FD-172 SS1]